MQNSRIIKYENLNKIKQKFTSRIAGYKAVVHNSIIVGRNC